MAVLRTRLTLSALLLVFAVGANAECVPAGHASSPASVCVLSELHWTDSNDWIHNPPRWLREAEESRRLRAPVPVLHLWRSQRLQTLLALGVNRRGLPGLYIARTLPY